MYFVKYFDWLLITINPKVKQIQDHRKSLQKNQYYQSTKLSQLK